MLAPVAREALAVMAGIYWDLGESGVPISIIRTEAP
jgi:hypothetical protein